MAEMQGKKEVFFDIKNESDNRQSCIYNTYMANFIKLTRSDGPRDIEFYLNANYLGQFHPNITNGGSMILVSNAPTTVALGIGDDIQVRETPEQIEAMIASRPHDITKDILIGYKYTSQCQWIAEERRTTAQCKDTCKINPDNIYAIFLDYTEKGTHSLYVGNGHYLEINDDNLHKIIPQNNDLPFAQVAQLPAPVADAVKPHKKPIQLSLNL